MEERMPKRRAEREYHAAVDSVLGALANYRRRAVVRELLAHPGDTVDVETLGALVAERETSVHGHGAHGTGAGAPGAGSHGNGTNGGRGPKRQNVVASLLHVHLPKLSDARIVAYDRDEGTVRCLENVFAEDILEVIDEIDETTEP